MDGNDVGMLKAGGQLDLAAETLGAYSEDEFGRQDLDDNASRQAGFGGKEHPAHASATELALDGIGGTECRLELISQGRAHREPFCGGAPR
jgi:hypothetical protein